MFHKLTIKQSWFCFVIVSVWCQADCSVEATTYILLDYMVLGVDHTSVWSGVFFVCELAKGFIKMRQRVVSLSSMRLIVSAN